MNERNEMSHVKDFLFEYRIHTHSNHEFNRSNEFLFQPIESLFASKDGPLIFLYAGASLFLEPWNLIMRVSKPNHANIYDFAVY